MWITNARLVREHFPRELDQPTGADTPPADIR
jgi:hypothetical protein